MLKLLRPNGECPPDQFRYKFRQDGHTVKCFDYVGWRARMAEHAHINDYPVPGKEEAEDQLCKLLPPGWCVQDTGEPPPWFLETRISAMDALRGTKVLATFIVQGMPLVEKSVAAERGAVCATCPFAIGVEGCAPCIGLSQVIMEIAGNEPLPSDERLATKSCAICKCAARAQIWLPAEILAKGVTDQMMEQFPDFCWKKAAMLELKQS